MTRKDVYKWALGNEFVVPYALNKEETSKGALLRQGTNRGEILFFMNSYIRYEQVRLSMPAEMLFAIDIPYSNAKLRSGDLILSLGSRTFTIAGR